ncbi:MAG: hypothetical protein JXN61_03870 [Sedimentisphaerales bacterium]|nr:hypothetical protein [Sedimentisphaerales bacterium]
METYRCLEEVLKSGKRFLVLRPGRAGPMDLRGDKAAVGALLWLICAASSPVLAGRIFVDIDAVGMNNGSSWENAYNHLRDAIAASSSGDEIRVAQGLYRPDRGSGITLGDRGATFHLVNDVSLAGGYAGSGAPVPDARNIAVYETVLSGDLAGNDAETIDVRNLLNDASRSENCYNVVTGTDCSDTTVVDGFTITGGNANGTRDRDKYGGGLHDGNLILSHCRIVRNSAFYGGGVGCYGGGTLLESIVSGNCARSGGGLYSVLKVAGSTITGNCAIQYSGGGMSILSAAATVTDSEIDDNWSLQNGGGLYVVQCNPTFTRCSFARNSADGKGGGIYVDGGTTGGSPDFHQCGIVGNTAGGDGGGIHSSGYSLSKLSNCVLSGNIASGKGAGMCDASSRGTSLVNCTLAHNSATNRGGGICYNSYPAAERVLTNCILWYNSDSLGATSEYSQICNTAGPFTVPVRYCDIQGWTGAMGGSGQIDTIGDEPLFADSDGADNIAGTEDDNFRLQGGSKCIDTGDNSAVEEGATDLDGKARIIHGIVDIGAYESKSGGPHVLPRYEVVDLGTLGGLYSAAYGINDFGQVVGLSETAAGAQHAFLRDEKVGMIDLGTLGGSASSAYAINNAGQVVGSARTANGELHAFLWKDGQMTDLGILPGGTCTEAYAINDAGQIVGMARTSAMIYSWQRAFLWENGIMTSLGVLDGASNSSAADINIHGQVVGTSGDRAFLWDCTSGMRKLTDFQSQGNAISDGGLLALASSGTYYIRDGAGVLADMDLIRYSRMNSINNCGQVVGDFDYPSDDYHAFLWDDSYGMIDLNYLAPAEAGWEELNSAGDINGDGRIVGYGWTDQGQQRAFLMSPISAEEYLVAHWELDESSGATAEDCIGNNDGILQGGPQWRPYNGRVNGALEFDGSDDYVDCGDSTVFDIADEITVAAWVNIRRVNVDWQTIVAKGDSAWRLSTAEDEMRFHFAVTGGPPWNFVNGDIVVDADEWHHVCGTYDGINMRLYVDGVEDSAGPVAESNGVSVNDYNVFIGENEERTGRHWDGLIDDVRIYCCPLTTAEVYELFIGAPIYVDGDSMGRNDGSTWADAFNSLQDALASASNGNRVRVAAGVYAPDSGAAVTPGDRAATFQLIDGVSVKGGFAGFGEPSPKLRDVIAYESILSGDLATDDGAGFENNAENSYHVVTGSGTNSTTVLDGFTISGGNAESLGGGGMLNISGGPTVTDCKFSANSAAKGGGMYNEQAYPTITGASFIENRAFLNSATDDLGGGGMYNRRSSPVLEDCLFAGNSVAASTGDGGDGGAIFCDQSSPTLVNCVILANTARRSGGGIASLWGGTAVGGLLVNCLFNANSAGVKGGGLDILDDTVGLTNCTFSANSATSGGGIYAEDAEALLVNCILYGNTDNGGNVENAQIRTAGGSLAIDYSCVEGWSGALGGTGNIGSNPHFEDADGADNIAGTEDDDLRISAGSLCIDAGSNAALPPFVTTDLDGNPRIIRDVVDMGAYEFAGMLKWYVDGDNGDDNNNGLSPETAFATIQKAVNTATEGYTVVVLPGVYQEDVYFNGKALTVTGEGSDATILESPSGYAVRFIRGEDANSVLKNVVIRNCLTYAGVRIENSSPKITNVTVVDNRIGIANLGGGHPDISNCIFWNNTFKDISCEVSCGSVTYCCIERGLAGEGNITADPSGPLFVDLAGGDYHLRSARGRHRPTTSEWVLDDVTSPCVDGGNPSANPSEERMPNGGRLNMGAFGGTYYASMSEWPLAGDLNRDGAINLKDFALVAEKWLSAMEWAE